MQPTDAMIEAGARALMPRPEQWDNLSNAARDQVRHDAWKVLVAALAATEERDD